MKSLYKILSVAVLGSFVLSGCIKETFPEGSTAVSSQVGASSSALQASVNGITSQMSASYLIYGSQTSELDLGWPSLMITFSQLTGEMYPVGDAGYDHFSWYNTCESCGPTTYRSYIPWRTLYIFVKASNDVIAAAGEEPANETVAALKGIGLTYRALCYYYMLNMYEPVANPYTDCSKVLGLTVPIVTEKTTEEQARNNPRATHDELVKFILSDLDAAEAYLANYTPSSKKEPSYAALCGLKARVYMSDGKYALAAEYARKAIDAAGCTPLNQTQWEDPTTGFNSVNDSWMWFFRYSAEEMGNLANWTGWMSGEADWGYASLTVPGIDAGLYEAIPDADWRKHSWLDPQKFEYYNYQSCRGAKWINEAPDYASIKFRPVAGDFETYSIGGVTDLPFMRIEEMYFIEAEAKGLLNLQEGIDALESFMKTYRYKSYSCDASSVEAFEKEILFQKKVEFWGEGIAFFDAKRMKAGCKQSYPGTNAPGDEYMINCEVIKPNWNFVIPELEFSSNSAIKDYNNPDPSSTAPLAL